ncbi:MAG: signal transduction histidine [Desulfovibrionaceae bacterium]|nr:MAG: signal transduction histidine [Desulfovibrionaceae bacterium]
MGSEPMSQTQAALEPGKPQAGELPYRRLASLASDFIHSCVRTGLDPYRIVWLGGAIEGVTGHSVEDIYAKGCWMHLVHPSDKSRIGMHLLALKAGDSGEIEFRLIHKNGSVRWVREIYSCEQGASPHELRLHGAARNVTERRTLDEVLTVLATGGVGRSGHTFFQFLAKYLAEILEMEFVCIDRLEGDGLTARTLAVYHDGHFEDNISYALKDTPCGDVVGKAICCFPRDVSALFPKDAVLQEMAAQSYLGVTLWDGAGQPAGLIAVIGRRPLEDSRTAENILRMVGVRASGELERLLAEEAMAASLREKEVLLREVHHRVKNNLQIVSSLLSLQEEKVDNPVALAILAESRGRVTSMALIHEQLYRSRDFCEIDAQDYLRQFLSRLVSAYSGGREVSLRLSLCPMHLSLDQAVPFGLIMNELVTNALKHGFKDRGRGELRVEMVREDSGMSIIVEDDGVGLPEGFDLVQAGTLGLQIVVMLAKQLRGGFTVESGHPARFRLLLPLAASGT